MADNIQNITIVTHSKPHHLDEVLAVGWYLSEHPDAKVVRLLHTEAEKDQEPGWVMIDTGGVYDPLSWSIRSPSGPVGPIQCCSGSNGPEQPHGAQRS